MPTVDESQVKEVLIAARNLAAARELRDAETLAPLGTLENAALSANRRDAQRLLADALAELPIDLERFESVRARNMLALGQLSDGLQAEAIKNAPAANSALGRQVKARAESLKTLQGSNFAPVVENIAAPFLIWATPSNTLTGSVIEPFNSHAKFFFSSTAGSGTRELTFYYLWSNPVDRFAVINIDGYLALNGFCRAGEDGGFWPGSRFTSINLTTKMVPLEWWNQPPTSPLFQSSQQEIALNFSASGGGGFGDVGAIEARRVTRASGLGYNHFLIPPLGVTVIEYTLVASFNSGQDASPSVLVDFDSGDFRVTSPFVTIQILT